MQIEEFIEKYDKNGSVVLLEGKRKVDDQEKEMLIKLGEILASSSKNIIYRSGNAAGADHYFSKGVANIDKTRLQVITPYKGHRKKSNQAHETYSIEDVNLVKEPEVIYHSKMNEKTKRLIDSYVAGEINRNTVKAAYIIRDTIKVIGSEWISRANFGIFYDDMDNPMQGGTGHTMHVCQRENIPFIDQKIWMKWL